MSTSGRVGFRAGMGAFTATAAYDLVQILQVVGVLHFPADEILIFGTSLCIVLPFLLEVVALHDLTSADKRFWTQAALALATMYAIFGSANYVIQLSTVIPAKLRGAATTVQLLEQTPHSLFWDFDAAAYICMGIAMLLMIPALRRSGVERWVRIAFAANVVATVLAGAVYFYPTYSYTLLVLGFPWGITAPASMLLLAIALRYRGAETSTPASPAAVGGRSAPASP